MVCDLVQPEVEQSDPDVLPPGATANEVMCSVLDEQNSNLTNAQKELQTWHFRWGHVSMTTIQRLIKPKTSLSRTEECQEDTLHHPVIIQSNFNAHNCVRPLCAAYNFGKAKRTKISTKSISNSSNGAIKREDLSPQDCVSMDHYQVG